MVSFYGVCSATDRMADTANTCSVDMQDIRMLTLCSCLVVVCFVQFSDAVKNTNSCHFLMVMSFAKRCHFVFQKVIQINCDFKFIMKLP